MEQLQSSGESCIGENARRSCGSCAHGYTCAHRYTYSDADSFDYTDSVSADMDTDAFTNGPAYAHAYTLPTFNPAVQTGLRRLRDPGAAARGLQVATDIPTALLPPEIVETTLKSILDIQRRQPELVNQARDLAAVGLVRPGFDLSRYAVSLPITPAASMCHGRQWSMWPAATLVAWRASSMLIRSLTHCSINGSASQTGDCSRAARLVRINARHCKHSSKATPH
jgi:hypothetical protein